MKKMLVILFAVSVAISLISIIITPVAASAVSGMVATLIVESESAPLFNDQVVGAFGCFALIFVVASMFTTISLIRKCLLSMGEKK